MRQNVKANLTRPTTALDYTAVAIRNTLTGAGWVYASDLRAAVRAAPHADVAYLPDAMKALRNMGFPLAAIKARHLSRYRLYADATEMLVWQSRVVREAYSSFVTTARSLAGAISAATPPPDPILVAVHAAAESAAIQAGRPLGIPLAQIVRDLQPI